MTDNYYSGARGIQYQCNIRSFRRTTRSISLRCSSPWSVLRPQLPCTTSTSIVINNSVSKKRKRESTSTIQRSSTNRNLSTLIESSVKKKSRKYVIDVTGDPSSQIKCGLKCIYIIPHLYHSRSKSFKRTMSHEIDAVILNRPLITYFLPSKSVSLQYLQKYFYWTLARLNITNSHQTSQWPKETSSNRKKNLCTSRHLN